MLKLQERRAAEFGPEVAAIRAELLDDRGSCPPKVQLLQGAVVSQVELDVLVAPALARSAGGQSQQVRLDAPAGGPAARKKQVRE